MEATKKYVVYELNRVMGSESHMALKEVKFPKTLNAFDSEEEAIQALIENKMTWVHYLIIPRIYITNY